MFDETKTYYIYNVETGKYLGFQTSYTESNSINATPLVTSPTVIWKVTCNGEVYNLSVGDDYLTVSLTRKDSNTGFYYNSGHSNDPYPWTITAATGTSYCITSDNGYLDAQSSNGYAYTNGTATSNCHWMFIPVEQVIENGSYVIHNKTSETDKYLGFQTSFTETNKINATPLIDADSIVFDIKFNNQTGKYTISIDNNYLALSTSCPNYNTFYDTTSYEWIILKSDETGYFYIQRDDTNYLNAQSSNGYAYTDGNTSSNCHWEFLKPTSTNKILTIIDAVLGDKLFELDGTVKVPISDTDSMTINDIVADFKSDTPTLSEDVIDSLEIAINDPMSYHMPNGRYLIRSHKFEDGFDDTYLSSLSSPLGIVEEAITYWSIWDVTNNGDGTFTIVNEGNKNILTPTKTFDSANPSDDGYLCYDTSKRFKYRVGSSNETSTITFKFIPANILFGKTKHSCAAIQPTSLPVNTDNEYTYLYMDLENGNGDDRRMDHVAKSEALSVVGDQILWNLYDIHSTTYIDNLGTHEGEAEMFTRMIDELAGHVGGVVTLENVTDVPCLNNINLLADEAAPQIATGQNGSTLYQKIVKQINDIKNNETLKVYYQDLREEQITGSGDTIRHPFFLENICGSRPTYGARLVQYSWGSNPNYNSSWHFGWITDYKDNVNTDGMFYITKSDSKITYHYNEDGTDVTVSDYYYLLKNGAGKYLKMYDSTIGNTDNVKCQVDVTADVDSAMHFVITPIIPGIWQIQDIQIEHTGTNDAIAETDNVYLTITKAAESTTNPIYGLTHYCLLETSALWRFVTSNELDPVTIANLDKTTHTTTPKALYATYSFPMNTMVSKTALNKNGENTHLKAYRCAFAWRNASRLRVDFVSLPTYIDDVLNDTCYYFEANKGYMIAGYSDKDTITCTTSFVSTSASIPDSCKLDDYMNLLQPVNTDIYINTTNWYNIFALTYNSPDSIIGQYYGKDVYGVGMGFYQLPVGSILPARSAYLPLNVFADAASQGIDVYDIKEIYVPTNSNVKGYIPIEISFDEEETDVT